ncbi:MAG: hypothetical protein K6F09_09010, partial [Clostridiales bacterium]|nr:hypothetical protein [Clostridiales bacterium]
MADKKPDLTNKKLATVIPYILIPILLMGCLWLYSTKGDSKKTEYYQVVQYFDQNQITEYTLNLSNGKLVYSRINEKGKKVIENFNVPNVEMFLNDIEPTVREYNKKNPDKMIEDKYVSGGAGSIILSILPTAILLLLMGGFLLFMLRRMNNTMTSENNRTLSFGK